MKRGLVALLAVAGILAGCASSNSRSPQTAIAVQAKSSGTRTSSEFDYAFDERQAAAHPVKAPTVTSRGDDDGDCSCQLHPHKTSSGASQAKDQ
jgi:hypothetical protein